MTNEQFVDPALFVCRRRIHREIRKTRTGQGVEILGVEQAQRRGADDHAVEAGVARERRVGETLIGADRRAL